MQCALAREKKMGLVDNSFYHQNLNSTKVLVLIPHQDDEINVAGNTIKNFNDLGAEVHVCYSTNGDYIIPASIRISEAISALDILGCSKENIHFMGYGDSLNNNSQGHIFYSKENTITSMAGYEETYAACGDKDYSFQYQNKHNQYNSNCFHNDLKHLILELMPDVIICVDLDTHADHRMLSLAFDDVMGEILHENSNYNPTVLKRFAYCLAYFADNDFYQINLFSNKKPRVNREKNYFQAFIDTAYYQWNSRIRLPVICGEYSTFLFNKTLTKALKCHKSQSAVMHAGQIINGDEVFFRRRTDSISYTAKVETSSGNGRYLNDFRILGLDDIDSMVMQYADYLWIPEEKDSEKKAVFRWEQPQNICKVVIYGNADGNGRINKIRISFDNGFEIISSKLLRNGTPLEINFDLQQNVSFCSLQILECEGDNYGIAECEFYSNFEEKILLNPLIKILIDDDFAYELLIDEDTHELPISFYSYDSKLSEKVKFINGKGYVSCGKLYLDDGKKFVLRLESVDNSTIYDQIVIYRKSNNFIKCYKFIQFIEAKVSRILFRAMRKCFYVTNKLRKLK